VRVRWEIVSIGGPMGARYRLTGGGWQARQN